MYRFVLQGVGMTQYDSIMIQRHESANVNYMTEFLSQFINPSFSNSTVIEFDMDKNHTLNLLKMEYDTLHNYYLWSLSTREPRQILCVTLAASVLAGTGTLLASSVAEKRLICAWILLGYCLIGLTFFCRHVSSQTTNIWCVYRINILRQHIRDTYGLHEIFKPASMGILRLSPDMFGLLKYRFGSLTFLIISNSVAASAAFLLILDDWKSIYVVPLVIVCGMLMFIGEGLYYRKKLDQIEGYLEFDAKEFNREVVSMNTMGIDTTKYGEKNE